jgi:Protein of unknown function, DUF547
MHRMSDTPNYLRGTWSILMALRSQRPNPTGSGSIDHTVFEEILLRMKARGLAELADLRPSLLSYVSQLEKIDPDDLSASESLAYWLNLYNAGALLLASEAQAAGLTSVLRTPGIFHRDRFAVVAETLSLDDVEHGKIRRFGDPRIHGALVCGSLSCPTLRAEPFTGNRLSTQLDDQMRLFLSSGAVAIDKDRKHISMSKVFQLYGPDFIRPNAMPSFRPARKKAILAALTPWLAEDHVSPVTSGKHTLSYQTYDWSLACTVR